MVQMRVKHCKKELEHIKIFQQLNQTKQFVQILVRKHGCQKYRIKVKGPYAFCGTCMFVAFCAARDMNKILHEDHQMNVLTRDHNYCRYAKILWFPIYIHIHTRKICHFDAYPLFMRLQGSRPIFLHLLGKRDHHIMNNADILSKLLQVDITNIIWA